MRFHLKAASNHNGSGKFSTHPVQCKSRRSSNLHRFLSDLTTDHHLQDPRFLSFTFIHPTRSPILSTQRFLLLTLTVSYTLPSLFAAPASLWNKTHCITKDRKTDKIWHSWDFVKSLPPTISLVICCIKRQTGRFKHFKSNTNMDSDPTNYASNLHI